MQKSIKVLSALVGGLLASSVAFSSENLAKQAGKDESMSVKFPYVYSVNKKTISDEQCRAIMTNTWEQEKIEKSEDGTTAVYGKNFQLTSLKFKYRNAGDKNTFIHLREGTLSLSLNGKVISSPVIVSSLFSQNTKVSNYMLQSLYCNAVATVKT